MEVLCKMTRKNDLLRHFPQQMNIEPVQDYSWHERRKNDIKHRTDNNDTLIVHWLYDIQQNDKYWNDTQHNATKRNDIWKNESQNDILKWYITR